MSPPWTPEMQRLWNRAMLLAATERAYGVSLPQPGTTYPRPADGAMSLTILFAATATDEEYNTYLEAVREDMVQWKQRVGKVRKIAKAHFDLSKLDIQL